PRAGPPHQGGGGRDIGHQHSHAVLVGAQAGEVHAPIPAGQEVEVGGQGLLGPEPPRGQGGAVPRRGHISSGPPPSSSGRGTTWMWRAVPSPTLTVRTP